MSKICTNLIVGAGEVGQGLQKVIGGDFLDPAKGLFPQEETYNQLHICFPPFDGFVEEVEKLKEKYKPDLVVIHSSVPVGTSRKCGAVHSPIRGVHPDIDLGIRTFVKYFGGERAEEASEQFKLRDINVFCVPDQETTEAGKLWDTTQYGVMIVLNKFLKKWCDKNGVDFDIVYTHFNQTYNDGYTKLNRPEVVRPYLKYMEGKIGGHCVIPNAKIIDNEIGDFILRANDGL